MLGARINPIKTAVIAILLMGFGVSAHAQGLRPLSEVLASDFEDSYVPMRCGGLFMSMAKYAGENAVGTDAYQGMLSNADNLLRISSSIRSNSNGRPEDENYNEIVQEAVSIAQLYIERFGVNYLNNGSAWNSDPDFLQDLSICTELSGG